MLSVLDHSKQIIKHYKIVGYKPGYIMSVFMIRYNPNHGLMLWFTL